MEWYGANFEKLKYELYYKGRHFDDQIATDTALIIYDAIALKGAIVDSPKHYFFRAYHTNAVRLGRESSVERDNLKSIDEEVSYAVITRGNGGGVNHLFSLKEVLASPDFNYELYEEVVDALTTEILDYVRATYPPFECSVFEIYIGLLPDTSYKKLSALLGIPITKIGQAIGAIRKDVSAEFKSKKDNMLSII